MEWLLELNRSLDYIEEQLEGDMQLEQIAGGSGKNRTMLGISLSAHLFLSCRDDLV